MPATKHLAVTEDTKNAVDRLKHKLSLRYDETFTHDKAVQWLLAHAPEPEDVDE